MKHTHLKRARLPIPPLGPDFNILSQRYQNMSGKRDSDPRPQPWQGCALPTELFPLVHFREVKRRRLELPRHNYHYPLKVARLPIPPPLRYVCNLLITSIYSAQNRTRTCTSLLTLVPETSASTIPPPGLVELRCYKQKERKTRLELATPTLARLCSTN